MTRTYEVVRKLADETGKSTRALEKDIGVGNGTIEKLKHRKNVSATTIKKFSDYFKKPMEYFM